ncbi:hypothetical protein F8388_005116 [Cannabis sativa]|uniref:Uncharacterized protein n=1 Tax=Cannabis sativa TaxID=3483 RepID=A0A7J6DUW2_CANSA|nr:hypothetical protein F8388_005116 [Cannabis sativa]
MRSQIPKLSQIVLDPNSPWIVSPKRRRNNSGKTQFGVFGLSCCSWLGIINKKLGDAVSPRPDSASDPEAEEMGRRERKRKTLLKLKVGKLTSESIYRIPCVQWRKLHFSSNNNDVKREHAERPLLDLLFSRNMSHSSLQELIEATIMNLATSIFSASQVLVQLCENNNLKFRANSIKLFCCVVDGVDEPILRMVFHLWVTGSRTCVAGKLKNFLLPSS